MEEANTKAISIFLNYGAVGAMLVLALITVVFLFKELTKERNGRLTDLKEYYTSDKAILIELKALIQNFLIKK